MCGSPDWKVLSANMVNDICTHIETIEPRSAGDAGVAPTGAWEGNAPAIEGRWRGQGDPHRCRNGIEPLPALDGEKLVVAGGTYGSAQAGRQAKHRFAAGTERRTDTTRSEFPCFRIDSKHIEAGLSAEIGNGSILAAVRE